MLITVREWQKLQPRGDYKSTPWLRVDNNIGHAKGLFGLSADQKWVWVCLLGLVAQANEDGKLEVDLPYLAAYAGVSEERTQLALDHFVRKNLIEIQIDTTIRTDDVREPNVERTLDVQHERTNERTNGTNGTDILPPLVSEKPERIKGGSKRPKSPPGATTPSGLVWLAYREAYEARYRQEPVRNAMVNGQCMMLVRRVGTDAAIELVRFYLTHNKRWYVDNVHAIGLCLKDAEALHTQMLAGHRMSSTEAQAQDKRQGTMQAFANVAAKLAAEREERGDG